MGRYRLQEELLLSDSSTKSLLNYCKKKEFFEISSNRKGHTLTKKGFSIVKDIRSVIVTHNYCEKQFFEDKYHYYVLFRLNSQNNQLLQPSWKIRDFAIAYGADSILLINISQKNDFSFPEEDIALENYYPELEDYFKSKFEEVTISKSFLLITTANNKAKARKSAIISVLNCDSKLYQNLQTEI